MSKEPRTAQNWLALPEDELCLALGEALTPGPWKHDTGGYSRHWCHKCKQMNCSKATACPVPDAIDYEDWKAVMEYIRETFVTDRQRSDYMIELVDMCDAAPVDYLDSEEDFMLWLLFITQPRKLWIAATLAVEGAKG